MTLLVSEIGAVLGKFIGFDNVILEIFFSFLKKENLSYDINISVSYKNELVYIVIDRGDCD